MGRDNLNASKPASSSTLSAVSIVAFLSLYAGLATALLRYGGLQHDAQVYVAQALLRIGETPLSGDLFFRYGSQGDFTLFPSFAAILISAFGIDHGAALLTAMSLVLLLGAVWTLTRTLVGNRFAWIAVALLIVLPAWYGSAEVFQIAERFLSARLPAVGLSLLALASLIAGRHGWFVACIALAFVVHPLMTLPAAAIGVTFLLVGRHPLLSQPLISLGLLLAVLVTGTLLGGASPLMDPAWLSAVRARSGFLFLDSWRIADWQNVVTTLGTLTVVASISERGPLRTLGVAVVAVAAVGLTAAAFTTWGLPVKWVIQAQTWRWMWPATVLAIALLPWLLTTLHRRHGAAGSAAAAAVACAWVLGSADRSDKTAMLISMALTLGFVFIVLLRARWRDELSRAWRILGASMAAAAVLWTLGMVASELSVAIDLGGDPYWVQKAIALLRMPAFGGICVVLLGLVLAAIRGRLVAMITILASMTLLLGAFSGAKRLWTEEQFGADVRAKFAPWRALIGEQEEVFWPDHLQATWFALDRRSYLSLSQLAGVVFSSETTSEARRRAAALTDVFPADEWLGLRGGRDSVTWTQSAAAIRTACSVPEIGFVVSSGDLGSRLPGIEWPEPGRVVYLYDCRQLLHQPTRD